MRVLITGGTGFIGGHYMRSFDHNQYTLLSRSPLAANHTLPSSVKRIADLSELQDLNNFDAVINLAGEAILNKRWTAKQKKIICHSRWYITKQLVGLFARSKQPPRVFVSGSAIGFYGESCDHIVTEQNSVFTHDFAHDVCVKWEDIAQQAEKYTRVVNLRTGIVLHSKAGALSKMLLPFKCGLGGKVGSGKQLMSWIHIEDMIAAMDFLLLDERASGAFNLTAPHPVSNEFFTETLAKLLNRRALLPIPEKLLRIVMGESADLLLNSQRVLPAKLEELGFVFNFQELKGALANLLNR